MKENMASYILKFYKFAKEIPQIQIAIDASLCMFSSQVFLLIQILSDIVWLHIFLDHKNYVKCLSLDVIDLSTFFSFSEQVRDFFQNSGLLLKRKKFINFFWIKFFLPQRIVISQMYGAFYRPGILNVHWWARPFWK